MKLWDSLTTCLILLLGAVYAGSLPRSTSAKRRGRAAETPLELPPVQIRLSVSSPGGAEGDKAHWEDDTLARGEEYTMEEASPKQFEDMVDFIKVTISRIRRSSSSTVPSSTSSTTPTRESRTRHRRERKKGVSQPGARGREKGGGGGGERGGGGARGRETSGRKVRGGGNGRRNGRGQGCVLKQIQLNVTDLSLGYRSSEEMIFRYCSGPCRKSETNYDKILYNLLHNRRLPPRDTPPQACCRPTAFDDDLSFLDDNLVYHTVRKHSARKCGCV